MEFLEGSIWRKWDLQVQPIKSEWIPKLNDSVIDSRIEQSMLEYLKIAKQKGINVLGITDHNSGKAIDFAMKDSEISIIPGVELDTPEGWHLLVFFSDSYRQSLNLSNWDDTINDFLSFICKIERPFFDENNIAKKISVRTLDLLKQIHERGLGFAVFAHCYSHDGFFRNGDPSDRISIIKAFDEGKIDFAFEIKDDLTQIKKINDQINVWCNKEIHIPIISSSDAHSSSDVGSNFTWIKADPTFEGLRQIGYEPLNRSAIQTNSPYENYSKPFFSKINIGSEFSIFNITDSVKFGSNNILLNQDLVTIIGGRGTGKSMLLNYLSWGFKKYDTAFLPSDQFKVVYNKNLSDKIEFVFDRQNDLNYIFISQNELVKKSNDPKEIYEEVKSTLGISNLEFNEKKDDEIKSILNQINTLEQWFIKKDENDLIVNDQIRIKDEVTRYSNLIETVTTTENKERLQKYTTNLNDVQKRKLLINELKELTQELKVFEEKMNAKFSQLDYSIPKVEFFGQRWAIEQITKKNLKEIERIVKENDDIKAEFGEYKGDLATLLEDIEKFQKSINILNVRLEEIKTKKEQLDSLYKRKLNFVEVIKEEYNNQKELIDKAWERLLNGKDDWSSDQKNIIRKILNDRKLEIIGEIVFDVKAFYEVVKPFVNGRVFKRKNDENALPELFEIYDFESYISYLNNKFEMMKKDCANYFYVESEYAIENPFFSNELRSKYIKVYPKIYYEGRTIDKLSAGQCGTIFLCLMLASKAFSQPIIYDQPEDDLDNQFIMNDLISIFKELRKFRQIIIITHNANLVVNTDSEQVIVANNDSGILKYYSGSLENSKIIEKVCDILEGGKAAFDLRKSRYSGIVKK